VGRYPPKFTVISKSDAFFSTHFFFLLRGNKTHKILITNLCSAIVGVAGYGLPTQREDYEETDIGQHGKPPTYIHLMMKKEHLQLQ
jgi:hypothetical protein